MTDVAVTGPAGSAPRPVQRSLQQPVRADPAQRGGISISNTAVAHLIEAAAGEIDGVLTKRSRGLGRSEGGVSALVIVDDSRVRLRLSLALHYPSAVPDVIEAVRMRVASRLQSLAGMQIVGFDVGVTQLVGARTEPRRVQ